MFADAILTGGVITQFVKLAAGEQLCRRCTHRKLQHFKTFKSLSWKITDFEQMSEMQVDIGINEVRDVTVDACILLLPNNCVQEQKH